MVDMQISSSLDFKSLKKGVSRAALAAALLLVAGCSTPDWADPTEWFDDDGGDASRPTKIEQPSGEITAEEGEQGAYPKLGSVPDDAGKSVSIQEANDIQEGLKADRENAQYTDEKLRADTAVQPAPVAKVPVAPAPSVPSTVAAAPAAVPAVPAAGPAVTAVPVPAVSAGQIPQPVTVPPINNVTTPAAVSSTGQFPQTAQVTGLKQIPNAAPVTTPTQAYTRIAPGTGTVVISGAGVNDVFQKQLAASAATTTTLPANTQFQSYPTQALGPTAVTVPQIVRDTYNTPVAAGYGAAISGAAIGSAPYRSALASGAKADAIIFFETGSSRIGAGDRAKLSEIAKTQKANDAMVRVVGHASSRTRELPEDRHMMVNLRMSQERSSAVVAQLIKMGVPTQSIAVESVSDSAPLTKETMPSAEAKNRRTEIFLVK